MPGGDRTGPMGLGPMTGRAAGYCGGSGMGGYANPAGRASFGMRFGYGRGGWGRGMGGGGRGWRNMFYATGLRGWMRSGGLASPSQMVEPETEKLALKNHADALQSELDLVRKRLGEIDTKSTEG